MRVNGFMKSLANQSLNYKSLALQMTDSWCINFLQHSFCPEKEETVSGFYKPGQIRFFVDASFLQFIDQTKELTIYNIYELDLGTVLKESSTYIKIIIIH